MQPLRIGADGGEELLDRVVGDVAFARAIADDGVAVGEGFLLYSLEPPYPARALLWPPDRPDGWIVQDLITDERWTLYRAVAVNADHWVLVQGTHPEEGSELVVVLKPVVWPR